MRLTWGLAMLVVLPLVLLSSAGRTAFPLSGTYLALGDSVAAGAGAPGGLGYVPLLADLVERTDAGWRLTPPPKPAAGAGRG